MRLSQQQTTSKRANGQPDGTPIEGETRKTSRDVRDLRVLDSACGSGSFLIYAYYVLADFYEREKERLEAEREARHKQLVAEGVLDPFILQIQLTPYTAELEWLANYPRLILETHLYGVDLDPQAAEIAVVNLMMRAMERRHQEKRLPLILIQNIKVGNSLVGLRYNDPQLTTYAEQIASTRKLRAALVSTPDGPQHQQLIRELEAATDKLHETLNDQALVCPQPITSAAMTVCALFTKLYLTSFIAIFSLLASNPYNPISCPYSKTLSKRPRRSHLPVLLLDLLLFSSNDLLGSFGWHQRLISSRSFSLVCTNLRWLIGRTIAEKAIARHTRFI